MEFDVTELKTKLQGNLDKLKAEVQKPNILLVGGTGVGKSSLINMIFGKALAQVGTGKPITQSVNKYESPDSDVCLYDSRGYEIGEAGNAAFREEVLGLTRNSSDPINQVHLAWYCINAAGHRVTEFDLSAIDSISQVGLPISILLLKTDLVTDAEVEALKNAIISTRDTRVFEISTLNHAISQHAELVEWSQGKLPEALQLSFIKSQKISLKAKWEAAHKVVLAHTSGSAVIGASPIPMSDAPLLLANQTWMIANILNVYNLGGLSNMLKGAGLEAILGPVLSMFGKSLVGNLIKLIPGVGSIVGGAISGSIAAAITFSLGEAVSAAGYGVAKATLEGDEATVQLLVANFGQTVSKLTSTFAAKSSDRDSIKEPK